jgi:hypothetical protein
MILRKIATLVNSEEFEWRALFKKRAGLPEPNFGSNSNRKNQYELSRVLLIGI